MVKVQEKRIKLKSTGKEYTQLWVPLPKALCEALRIEKGMELKVFVERGDLILRKI